LEDSLLLNTSLQPPSGWKKRALRHGPFSSLRGGRRRTLNSFICKTPMFSRVPGFLVALALGFLLTCPLAAQNAPTGADKSKKDHKQSDHTVWNLDGGAFFETDGGLPNGACFRMAGHVTAPGFFDGLKRFDDDDGTFYMRGEEVVRTFPEKLFVTFSIRDFPCTPDLKDAAAQPVLTPEMMSKLRFGLFWKSGVEMQLIRNYQRTSETLTPIVPYATDLAEELPKRFVWRFAMTVPSKNVPITDSLVFVLATPDGHLAARVSARL
jgi:hypothetical protein